MNKNFMTLLVLVSLYFFSCEIVTEQAVLEEMVSESLSKAVPTSGLVFEMLGDGNLTDSSGYSNNGQWVGPSAYTVGAKGQALSFDGDSYVKVNSNSILKGFYDHFSISFWMKTTYERPSDQMVLFDQLPAFSIEINDGANVKGSLDFRMFTKHTYTAYYHSFGDNNWHHVVFTYNKSQNNLTCYVDNVLIETMSISFITDSVSCPLFIGGSADPFNDYPYTGLLDEIRIYSKVITAGEVTELFEDVPVINRVIPQIPNPQISGDLPIVNVNGKDGLFYDGDGYIYSDDPALQIGAEDFTIKGSILTNSGSFNTIIDNRETHAGTGYHLTLYGGVLLLQMSSNGLWYNYYVSGTRRVDDGQWHSFEIQVDRDNINGMEFYVDGLLQGIRNPTALNGKTLNGGNTFFLGRHVNGSIFDGYLADMEIIH